MKAMLSFFFALGLTVGALAQNTGHVRYANGSTNAANDTGIICSEASPGIHCTNGTYLIIGVSPKPITDSGWPGAITPTQSYGGLTVEAPTDCYQGFGYHQMVIFGVYAGSAGANTDILVYYPGGASPEYSSQTCPSTGYYSNTKNFTVYGQSGSSFGSTAFGIATKVTAEMPTTYKGAYYYSGSGPFGANGYHYNTTTGVYTPLADCETQACPVSTGGVANYLILYTSGMEKTTCGTQSTCANSNLNKFKVKLDNIGGRAEVKNPPIEYIGQASYLQQQVNIKLSNVDGYGCCGSTTARYFLTWENQDPTNYPNIPASADKAYVNLSQAN